MENSLRQPLAVRREAWLWDAEAPPTPLEKTLVHVIDYQAHQYRNWLRSLNFWDSGIQDVSGGVSLRMPARQEDVES